MNLDKLFDRNNPSSWLDDKVGGWLPGIILDLDDPKQLGRIRVKCPLIDNNAPLPNNNDGWIQMLNPSKDVLASIEVGDQVAMLAMMGDLKQCIAIGVLHSNQDPPSPHFNRPEGVYGSHNQSGDLELVDLKNRRELKVKNGYVETIDAEGNKTIESPGGAKVSLGASGDVRIENSLGTIGFSDLGELKISNGKATLGFDRSGAANLSLLSNDAIAVAPSRTYISSPNDPVARDVAVVKKGAAPLLTSFAVWSGQLRALSGELREGAERPDVLVYQVDEILERVIELLQKANSVLPQLEQLENTEIIQIGATVVGQIDRFRSLNLIDVVEQFGSGLTESEITSIETALKPLIPTQVLERIDLVELQIELSALTSDPDKQLLAILGAIVPLNKIDAVLSQSLHRQLDRLKKLTRTLDELKLNSILDKIDSKGESGLKTLESIINSVSSLTPPISPELTKTMLATLKNATEQVRKGTSTIADNIKVARDALGKIEQLGEDVSLEREFGTIAQSGIQQLKLAIASLPELIESALEIESLTTSLLQGSESQSGELDPYTEILPEAIEAMLDRMTPWRDRAASAFSIFEGSLTDSSTGGGIELTPRGKSSSSNSGATGGTAFESDTEAALYGPGANRGLGAKIIADGRDATMSALGADAKLGGRVKATPKSVELTAPGAELGLGAGLTLTQEDASLYAPGGNNKLGSSLDLSSESAKILAPGGESGAGSQIKVDADSVKLHAPGGSKGSSLVLNLEHSELFSPGGTTKGGTKIKLAPDKLTLSYPGLTGGNIVMGSGKIDLDLPLLQNSIELTTTGITIKSLLAKIKVSPISIDLKVGGMGFTILPGVILVNGVPLQAGGQFF